MNHDRNSSKSDAEHRIRTMLDNIERLAETVGRFYNDGSVEILAIETPDDSATGSARHQHATTQQHNSGKSLPQRR